MEHVRVRDNSSSPHPAENPATPLIHDPVQPSLPPSTTDLQSVDKTPPESKPLGFRGFEKPSFIRIGILTVLCLVAYPAFYALTLVAKDKSLFIVRLIVSVWCSVIGFVLGYIVLMIAAQHLEAASESIPVRYQNLLTLYFVQPGPP